MNSNRDRLDSVVERLRSVIEELDEVAFDVLREASADRAGRPTLDKEIVRARRAIEKAVSLLSGD